MSRILIINDNPIAMKTIEVVLEKEYQDIDNAKDGKMAWALLKQKEYDLIITEMMLPYITGLELIFKIKKDATFKAYYTPVLIVSDIHEEDAVTEGFNAGANDYLKKPFDPGDLLSRVKKLLTANL
ncbi:MAG: response regulator transcription factor [Niabella sp.]|nr:response regulator transcription factor [Niabella sp.]